MPLSGGAAAAAARRRQRDFGFPHPIRREIGHVCRGRLRRLRALLLRRPAGRGNFSLAIRAESRALQAGGVNYLFGSFCRTLPMSAQGSLWKRFVKLSTVKSAALLVRPRSSHDSGAETAAPGRARVEEGETGVAS